MHNFQIVLNLLNDNPNYSTISLFNISHLVNLYDVLNALANSNAVPYNTVPLISQKPYENAIPTYIAYKFD